MRPQGISCVQRQLEVFAEHWNQFIEGRDVIRRWRGAFLVGEAIVASHAYRDHSKGRGRVDVVSGTVTAVHDFGGVEPQSGAGPGIQLGVRFADANLIADEHGFGVQVGDDTEQEQLFSLLDL